jgi:phenylpyruvate tautomerase PptA (4-oxalocrotonate tautomerase family)
MLSYAGDHSNSEEEPTMPHIVIKTISGPSQKQLRETAEQIAAIVNKTMGKPEKYISVSVEEYSFGSVCQGHSSVVQKIFKKP